MAGGPVHVIEASPPDAGADADIAVVVHGGRDRGESFRGVAEHAGELRVVAYDRRGYGESPSPGGPAPFEQHVDDLIDVIGHAPASVVGHSWGGHVAIAAAIARPDLVRSVGVFETTWLWMDWWAPQSTAAVRAFAERGWPGATHVELALMRSEVATMGHVPYDLTALTVPCLIGYGSESLPAETADSYRRAAELIGADLVVLDGLRHNCHRSHPDAFAAFVRRTVGLAALGAGPHRDQGGA